MILVQVINFGLLLVILRKFLYKPVIKAIKDRQTALENIEKGKVDIAKEAGESEEKAGKIIRQAKAEADKIVASAKKEAEEIKKKELEKANTNARDILEKANTQAERLSKDQASVFNKKVIEVASLILKKVLPDSLTEKDHNNLVESTLSHLRKVKLES